ncbi:hypothetical protein MLD38_007854 [Melastoma candidum]|uniref:Uncharacterized protein n=1 Tax=Melastoma candidum TaxID=119954 RepID=A0ACB9RVG5_9MYRT|nr:hypothetical protein MLD38_007854 [Melastoma candidum]
MAGSGFYYIHLQFSCMNCFLRLGKKRKKKQVMEDVHLPRRSVSLPSRLPSFDSLAMLLSLKSLSTTASVAPPCSMMIQFNLGKLVEMYEGAEQLVRSSLGRNRKNVSWIEEAVNDSILLLDICGYARDAILSTKQEVGDLQSVMRRKSRGDSAEVARQVKSFMCHRKNTGRAISKHFDKLRRLERKYSTVNTRSAKIEDEHSSRVREAMRELIGFTVSVLQSVLTFLRPSERAMGSRHGWSFVLMRMLSTEIRKQRAGTKLEGMEYVDWTICSLWKSQATADSEDVRSVRAGLENVIVGSIEGIEERLDGLHKCLIRNRICLLDALLPR